MTDPISNTTANDNDATPENVVSVADLASMIGIDEDTLLRRMAEIFSKRSGEGPDE